MSSNCCSFGAVAGHNFNAKRAAGDLARYRARGPNPTSLMLLDGLTKAGQLRGSLLDVGAGVGALTFELLGRGMSRATIVEASPAFLDTASQDSARRGCAAATDFVHRAFL